MAPSATGRFHSDSDAVFSRVAARLDQHVRELVAGAPWMPLQMTLGISGYETSFDHPDQTFYALSIALPFLSEETRRTVQRYLKSELTRHPPYAENGYDRSMGRARESFEIPPALRRRGQGTATSLFGIYAFWAYVHFSGEAETAAKHWPAIRARCEAWLAKNERFDFRSRPSGREESMALNGNLAGLIGYLRLARRNGDQAAEARAFERCRQMLEARINLDRVNPALLEPSFNATKSLHHARLSRCCFLVPEVAGALAAKTGGCAAGHLQRFRAARNGWHLAWGDRWVGGENFTSPLHLPAALFAGAAGIERLPARELAGFLDVPWCRGDLFYMEKCAWILRAAAAEVPLPPRSP